MFCKNCGNMVKDGMRFCTKCGAPVGVSHTDQDLEKIELENLEKMYQTLVGQKDKIISDLEHESDELWKEIEGLISQAESAELVQMDSKKRGDRLEYCPFCGFHVGDMEFCGRCGRNMKEV